MPNFKTLTDAERKTVQSFIDDLRDHADKLQTLLTDVADHTAAIDLVENHTGNGRRYGLTNSDMPDIAYRLKNALCPECYNDAESCDCSDEDAATQKAA